VTKRRREVMRRCKYVKSMAPLAMPYRLESTKVGVLDEFLSTSDFESG